MFGGNDISYAEGSSIRGNTMNESLSVNEVGGALAFWALMGEPFGRTLSDFDARNLSIEQAAEYLWRRFVAPLEY